MPSWLVLVIGGILFAAAHLDVYGFVVRAGLGVILGWLVMRTGSIVPAMIAHAVYDGSQLGILSYMVHHQGADGPGEFDSDA